MPNSKIVIDDTFENEIIAKSVDGEIDILSLEGKRKILNSGYGSIRLKP